MHAVITNNTTFHCITSLLLPPPMKICNRCLSVYLSVSNFAQKLPNFRIMDSGIVSRIRHFWEIQKVVNGHSFILIRQIAALVGRALAEVCTDPVLLVQNASFES